MSKLNRIAFLLSCLSLLTALSCQFLPKAFAEETPPPIEEPEPSPEPSPEEESPDEPAPEIDLTPIIVALGVIVGVLLVSAFSGGMRNAT